jgi:PAS domain S-box-containing protein
MTAARRDPTEPQATRTERATADHASSGPRNGGLLSAIIESSDDAIVSKDLSGNITSWNPGAERIFGYTAEEVIGRSVTILIPEDRQDEEPGILERIRRGDRIDHYETVRRRKDGTLIDISLTVSPIRDSEGRIVGASKIARDVTERKRAEEERRLAEERLHQSREQYGRLANLLPVGVYTCAADGTIIYFNEQAAVLWGRAPRPGDTDERFCGSAKLFVRGSDAPLPHQDCPMAVALREGTSYRNEEVVIERPDGSRVTALVNIDPIRDPDGHLVGAINVFHDVSALKRAEEALREEKENLHTLLDTLPVAVFLAHDPHGRRISGNRAAARLLRMADDENLSLTAPTDEAPTHFTVRTPDGEQVPPDMLPIQRAARGELVSDEALTVLFDDGAVLHELVSAQPLHDGTGKPRGAIACILDVTTQKQTENALREADRRKDEFLATLAHELRSPLAPIVAGLEIMQMAPDDREIIERTRSIMERQAMQLVTLVDDLLNVSRITRGKLQLRQHVTSIRSIIETALEAIAPAIEQGGLTLTYSPPDRPLHVLADPNRLAQVLSNLLSNAAKYTPPGGRVEVVAVHDDEHVSISVSDTGIGIPPEMAEGIFAMFAQIDRPQERGHAGLGIGLTLAKSLVEMHGGTIFVQSEGVDKGSTFTVRLPLLRERGMERSMRTPATRDDSAASGRRVLVVDDNEAMVDALSTMLGLLGSEVRTASNGQLALDVAAEFRPDVVLMDLGMPVMSGYEAARRMRQEPWGSDLRLVALTGWGQEEHKQRTLDAGFDQHLVKPVRPADLEQLFSEA